MAPDGPTQLARNYPQSSAPTNSQSEAQTRFPPPVDVPPNFRQLSLAPFAAQVQDSGKSNAQSNFPDHLWTASPENARSAGAYGDGPTVPWWAPPPPPMLPVRAGRFAPPRAGGVGGPTPLPWPSDPPKIPMPEAWKIFGPMLMLYPELVREHLQGERGESKEADVGAGPILELHQEKSSRGSGSKTWRDVTRAFNKRHYEMCDQQKGEEVQRCLDAVNQHPERNYSEYPYRDWVQGCKDRAEDRRTICRKTGEIPAWPAEWGPSDEETWFNPFR